MSATKDAFICAYSPFTLSGLGCTAVYYTVLRFCTIAEQFAALYCNVLGTVFQLFSVKKLDEQTDDIKQTTKQTVTPRISK